VIASVAAQVGGVAFAPDVLEAENPFRVLTCLGQIESTEANVAQLS
jgi:hypothetical protein